MVIDKNLMVSGVCGSIRALCTAIGDKLVADVFRDDAADYVTISYGGVEIDPAIILNSRIAKCLGKLQDTGADYDALESELLGLLIMKRSGVHLAKAIEEAGVEQLKAKMAENAQAIEAAKITEKVQETVANPEVKRRRKRKQPVVSEFVATDEAGDVLTDFVTDPIQPVSDPFNELAVKDVEPVGKVVIEENVVVVPSAASSMDDFLKQERLKAMAALNEPSI